MEGETDMEGRLEVCLGQRWGTVTDDGWSNANAQTVCNQLGYSSTGNSNARYCYNSYNYFMHF